MKPYVSYPRQVPVYASLGSSFVNFVPYLALEHKTCNQSTWMSWALQHNTFSFARNDQQKNNSNAPTWLCAAFILIAPS